MATALDNYRPPTYINNMVNRREGSLDAVFGALADPIRRGILEQLSQHEATVGELAKPYRVSAPAISRHLRVLERAGLIERHKNGRNHRCRLQARPMDEAATWIAKHRAFWEQQFDSLQNYLV